MRSSPERHLRLAGMLLLVSFLTYHTALAVTMGWEETTVSAHPVEAWDFTSSREPEPVTPEIDAAIRQIMALQRELEVTIPEEERLLPLVPWPPAVTLTVAKPKTVFARTFQPPAQLDDVLVLGKQMAVDRFGKEHWKELYSLWSKESGWDHTAQNPSSGACGIPQALPCSKMPGFPHNPKAQIKWGLGYISGRYGNPTKAWEHFLAHNWY